MQSGIKKEFFKYISSNIMGMIGLSCYILADTYFIAAKMGSQGLTSLNLAISIYSFINGLGLMIGIGAATRFGIYRSQSRQKEADETFTSAVFLGGFFGILLLAIGVIGAEKLSFLLGARGEILPMTTVYLRTILCFSPCFLLNNIFLAFVRNDKAPQLAMAGMLLGSLTNIVMDYIFIFPLDLGMFGAAFATGTAPVVSMIVLLLHRIKKRNHFHFSRVLVPVKQMIHFCSLGVSALINEISSGIVLIVFNLLILQLEGDMGVAAYGIVANLALVAVSIFTGISQGAQPMISRFYGKKDREGARKVCRYGIIVSLCFGILLFLCVLFFTPQLVQVFNSEHDPALAKMAEEGLRLYFIGFLFVGVNIITAAYLAAIEEAAKSFQISVFRGMIGILIFALGLSAVFHMKGIWIAFPCTEAAALVLSWRCIRKEKA
ncbi:MAG: MATE family efflux transporter [Eubacteriales bacterium]|nr:MATE family efflux transporter [Eubacteriales bacterium]